MKLVIFDIDDTITNETSFLRSHAETFLKRKYGINAKIVKQDGYDLAETYGLENFFIQQGYTRKTAGQKCDEINKAFWNRYFVKYCMQPIKPGVMETVNIFRDYGYKICFLSLRGKQTNKHHSLISDFIRLNIVPFLTMIQLKRAKIVYDELKLVKTKEHKTDYINAMFPDYVFEDQPEIIRKINKGPKIYCIKNVHNQKASFTDGVLYMEKFEPKKFKLVLEKDNRNSDRTKRENSRITTDISLFNPLYIKKIFTEIFYTLSVAIGKPFFSYKYHPIVKGKENIQSKGATAFVGNHRNKLDPVVVAVSSYRKIHWGALLRMLQGKESLFSLRKNLVSCYASAFFITAMGAIPIARNTDENYFKINMNSISRLRQILAWNGAVGLFPEGTLNREPQKQNVLPLKSNGIFKLAKDYEGIIQTFSIVWIPKELNIRNRVIISYGIPINTRNRNAKELLKIWDDMLNSEIEKSNGLIEKFTEINKVTHNTKERARRIKEAIRCFVNR